MKRRKKHTNPACNDATCTKKDERALPLHLPLDIWLLIFDYLPQHTFTGGIARVCKQWFFWLYTHQLKTYDGHAQSQLPVIPLDAQTIHLPSCEVGPPSHAGIAWSRRTHINTHTFSSLDSRIFELSTRVKYWFQSMTRYHHFVPNIFEHHLVAYAKQKNSLVHLESLYTTCIPYEPVDLFDCDITPKLTRVAIALDDLHILKRIGKKKDTSWMQRIRYFRAIRRQIESTFGVVRDLCIQLFPTLEVINYQASTYEYDDVSMWNILQTCAELASQRVELIIESDFSIFYTHVERTPAQKNIRMKKIPQLFFHICRDSVYQRSSSEEGDRHLISWLKDAFTYIQCDRFYCNDILPEWIASILPLPHYLPLDQTLMTCNCAFVKDPHIIVQDTLFDMVNHVQQNIHDEQTRDALQQRRVKRVKQQHDREQARIAADVASVDARASLRPMAHRPLCNKK